MVSWDTQREHPNKPLPCSCSLLTRPVAPVSSREKKVPQWACRDHGQEWCHPSRTFCPADASML